MSGDVERTCRLCRGGLLVRGVISNSRRLFRRPGAQEPPLSDRFRDVGLDLPRRPAASGRICGKCFRQLVKVENAQNVLKKWRRELHGTDPQEEDPGRGVKEDPGREEDPGVEVEVEEEDLGVEVEEEDLGVEEEEEEMEELEEEDLGVEVEVEVEEDDPGREDEEAPPPRKRKLYRSLRPAPRCSITEVFITYPSKMTPQRHRCDSKISGVINHLAKGNFTTAARLMARHEDLMEALKPIMAAVVDEECRRLCRRQEGFMLWKSSPEELEDFSLRGLRKDLERMAPFMFSVMCTVSGARRRDHACVAAAIALRGREDHLSAFAYHVSGLLQRGGARKAVFTSLSRMGITTAHSNALLKRRSVAKHRAGEPLLRAGEPLLRAGEPLLGGGEPLLCGGEPFLGGGEPLLGGEETDQESIGEPATPDVHQCQLSDSEMSDVGVEVTL
ncbi:unnamed protein product [Merluccius merluccius]